MDPYLATVIMFAADFAPRGWAFCSGQFLTISQNQALFSLLGTTYGGNGQTTFALPDLRGRTPIHPGTGAGLPSFSLGQVSGAENITLLQSNLPVHNHVASLNFGISTNPANSDEADDNVPAVGSVNAYRQGATTNGQLGELPFRYKQLGEASQSVSANHTLESIFASAFPDFSLPAIKYLTSSTKLLWKEQSLRYFFLPAISLRETGHSAMDNY